MIAVVDYDAGNIRSVTKALESLGVEVRVTGDPADIEKADGIILPGVGAFGKASQSLEAKGLMKPLRIAIRAGKPFFGICLGMQLLYEQSEENPGARGLGVIKGRVIRFSPGLKIPHLGWNQVFQKGNSPLWNEIPDGSFFYFAHSFFGVPTDGSMISGETGYGVSYASSIHRGALYGVQFHPEKSQKWGLKLLANFIQTADRRC
jgi:imidazole glycerol-phosphate synthase subunit HisH